MAFEYPCDLKNMDLVLKQNSDDLGWIAVDVEDKDNVLCMENSAGYSYVFFENSEDELRNTVSKYTDSKYNVMQTSVLNVLHKCRAIVHNGEPSLILGCSDYLCDTALVSNQGMLYPHAFLMLSYIRDEDAKPLTDEWGSLICAGSTNRLIQTSCASNHDLMMSLYSNKSTICTEPLIYLARQYKSLLCEGSTCNVPLALAHSYHARNSKNV